MLVFQVSMKYVVLFLASFAYFRTNESAKCIAIFHIGPHKTGTSAFQTMVYEKMWKKFEKENYYSIPKELHLSKKDDYLSWLFTMNIPFLNSTANRFAEELQEHKEKNHNLIISTEGFDRPNVNLSLLFHYLRDFDVRLAVVHRCFLSAMLSMYNEDTKYMTDYSLWESVVTFSQDLGDRRIGFSATSSLAVVSILHRFESYVEKDKIFIFDYYGILEANKNEEIVMIEALIPNISRKLEQGIRNYITKTGSSQVNKHVNLFQNDFSLIATEFFRKFFNIEVQEKCKNYLKKLEIPRSLLPMSCVSSSGLQEMKHLSTYFDVSLRDNYGYRIIYGNPEANSRVLDTFQLPLENEDSRFNPLCSIDDNELLSDFNFHLATTDNYQDSVAVNAVRWLWNLETKLIEKGIC